MADQNKGKFHNDPMRTQHNHMEWPQALENASNQVAIIGFSFPFDWL